MMIRTILIDDEQNALDVLAILLKKNFEQIEIIASTDNGEEGIQLIQTLKPDLVFLDIEMPHVNGFDVMKATEEIKYNVIITTAYNQFAVKAFKFAALDYLLKPIDMSDLREAIAKVKLNEFSSLQDKLDKLLTQYPGSRNKELIALQVGDGLQMFKPDDIVRCESESNYTNIFLKKGTKILLSKTLKEIEESLQGLSFFRIHQSHLINMNHIERVLKNDGGSVLMSDGSEITISRYKKELFFEQFRKL
jgi:two-component system, LytTR family, response regulator